MSKPKEFMDKKWNYKQYDAVAHIVYWETKKTTGDNFLNSIEQMRGLWMNNKEYKKNIISQSETSGLGDVDSVLAWVFSNQTDTYLSINRPSALKYREGFQLSFQRLGVTLYNPKNRCRLLC